MLVDQDDAMLPIAEVREAQRLQSLQPDHQIRLSWRDHRRPDLRAEAHVGLHTAAALRHAVHLGLLDVIAFADRSQGGDFRTQQHSLSAHAGEKQAVHLAICLAHAGTCATG